MTSSDLLRHPHLNQLSARWMFRGIHGGVFKDITSNQNHMIDGSYDPDKHLLLTKDTLHGEKS